MTNVSGIPPLSKLTVADAKRRLRLHLNSVR